jgi:uncharacterized membrane-anchored protein YhcB (DUF1043 family)
MLETLPSAVWAGIFVVAVIASFLVGRRTGSGAHRVRALKEALETACGERDRSREELDGYRKRVSDHFAETSEKLRDLTLQYRDVYDHLARGAGDLCPDGFAKLEGGLGLDALPEASSSRSPADQPGAPEATAEAERPDAPDRPTEQAAASQSVGF